MHECPRAAVTKYTNRVALNHRSAFSLSSGRQKSAIRGSAGLVPSGVCDGECPVPSPTFWGLPAIFDVLGLQLRSWLAAASLAYTDHKKESLECNVNH